MNFWFTARRSQLCGKYVVCHHRIYFGLKNIGNTPKAQFDELSLNHHCRIALKSRVFIFLKNKTKHMKCLL